MFQIYKCYGIRDYPDFIYGSLKVILIKEKFYYLSGTAFENLYNKSTQNLINDIKFTATNYI